jgi:hypothetical protein
MAEFNILDHLDKLTPDNGSAPKGSQSFYCPACDAKNFKVELKSGKYNTFSCDCAATESGKRKIRAAIEPPINPNAESKPTRFKQERCWQYFTPLSLENGKPALEVHRVDDGNGGRKIWQKSLVTGRTAAEVKDRVLPYGLQDALQALADGAPYVYWVEGEPCVDALRKLDLYAITSIGGAGKFNPDRDGGHIPPDRLVIVPDRDKPGVKHAEAVAAAHPGCQWLYPFPNTTQWNGSCPPDKGLDIADWIAAGATVDQIINGIGPKLSKPAAEPSGVAKGDSLNEWEELLSKLVNPKHALFERNTVRRQIRAATAAADAGLRVSPQQARSRLIAKQRELITGTAAKGTAGGQKVKAPEKKWLVSNLIPLQCLTAIAAFAKVGKTKFICAVAASLAHQKPLMGNHDWQPAPGPHKLILWLTDQPAADTNGYLQAVGLMDRDGTLHSSIVKLYTEEDDLAWDDQGIDQLLEDITANPGVVLITDSFYANVQRPYGSDQEPEAGGALIDIQTLLSQSQITHLCCFHAPKETGLTGVNAIRGHGSAAGVPSAVVSLHFLERKDPSGNGKWVADKDNPYRRMVVEGRAPYRDLLVRLDGEAGIWSCHGDYSSGISQLAQGQQADELPDLTQDQRKVLDVIGTKAGLAVKQIAYEWKGREPSKTEIEQCRKKINALVRKRLVSEKPSTNGSTYSIRASHTERPLPPTGEMGGTQSQSDFSWVTKRGGEGVAGVAEIETHQVPLMNATVTTPPPPLPATLQNDVVDRVPPQSPPPEPSPRVREASDNGPATEFDF